MLVGGGHAVIAEDQQTALTPRRLPRESQHAGNAGRPQRTTFEPLEYRKRLILVHPKWRSKISSSFAPSFRKSGTARFRLVFYACAQPIALPSRVRQLNGNVTPIGLAARTASEPFLLQ